ncbi:succinylglutamate desuccinylase/aspartoacylase family protein [Simiduia agarivorans]|uniref:Deacylase n=1 Tax=Simiduia agarivorans (strain DSM 21679 / JCM 13881 / BCRC 17597 / SA1) TaxID=1117647 RepID=K4KNZ7_SIMAS|nr:succinylglutamate desuccinylase/aspartoacylase family protein [Simiduia agarivorans]AFV00732.1 putative deacylase [Simiduia agarivorans SA1 = DSM 21679]
MPYSRVSNYLFVALLVSTLGQHSLANEANPPETPIEQSSAPASEVPDDAVTSTPESVEQGETTGAHSVDDPRPDTVVDSAPAAKPKPKSTPKPKPKSPEQDSAVAQSDSTGIAPVPPTASAQPDALVQDQAESRASAGASAEVSADEATLPKAENVNLREVVAEAAENSVLPPALPDDDDDLADDEPPVAETQPLISAEPVGKKPNSSRTLLGVEVPASTTTRLGWTPSKSFAGMAVDTPVLVVNGAWDGPTLCLTAAVHGDELNGIEMVRRVMYDLDPTKLHGMVVGVPIVNLLGFSRNSRYLPDRRDLNRYFPGNSRGSVASRLAHAFFNDVILHCNALVDLHTGSFYRTNIPQLRADMRNNMVADFTNMFGSIPVLNTRGNRNSLRAAAVRAGIPAVTLEAGEPMRMQTDVVEEGVRAIKTLMEKNGMYPSFSLWAKPSPAFYRSSWVRANGSGILFSKVALGDKVREGQVLGEVINPITNEKKKVVSKYNGRVLGMALDQFVLPGFAAYHIGILAPRDKLSDPTEEDEALIDEDYKPELLDQPKPMTPEEEGFDDE